MSPTPASELFDDLRELTALPGPPGSEDAVAAWLGERLAGLSLSPAVDPFGNLRLADDSAGTRVLITAHMDQVGYIVSRVEERRAVCLPMGAPDLSRLPGSTASP